MHAKRGACDDTKAALAQAGDREVALDAATLVEHLRVGQRADVASDSVVGQALEKLSGSAAAYLDLGERCEIENCRRLAARPVLDADRRRPEVAGPAVRAQGLIATGSIWFKPVHPLPTRLLAERRTEVRES